MFTQILRSVASAFGRPTPGAGAREADVASRPQPIFVVGDHGLGIALLGSQVRLWSDTGKKMDFGTFDHSIIGTQHVLQVSAITSLWYRTGAGNRGEDLVNLTYRVAPGGREIGVVTKAASFCTPTQQADAKHLVTCLSAATGLSVQGTTELRAASRG